MSQVTTKTTRFSKLNNAPIELIYVNNDLEPLSSAYLLSLLNRGKSLSEIRLQANTLKSFYRYCIEFDIDFPSCFKRMEQIPSGTIEHLAAYISTRKDTGEIVAAGTFDYRWQHLKSFLIHVWRFYQERLIDANSLKAAQVKQEVMREALKEYGRFGYKADRPDKIGLPPELKIEFFNIIHPGEHNQLNPWKSEIVRWRNYCLFLTMILGGNRKGETLLLKVADFSLTGPASQPRYFEFRKSSTVTADYGDRKFKPSVKTKGRKVELHPVLADVFEYYISKIRPKFKGAKTFNNMFLSFKDGQPMSITAPNQALDDIIKAHPQFEKKLTPHILRNTWSDSVRNALDAKYEHLGPLARQGLVASAMEYGGGWARGSEQVDRYPKGAIERRMADVHMFIQGEIVKESENS